MIPCWFLEHDIKCQAYCVNVKSYLFIHISTYQARSFKYSHSKISTMACKPTYDQLANTAQDALLACLPKTKGSNDPDPEAILSHLAPDFYMDFGHKFFVSTLPQLQGKKDGPGFVAHLSGMATSLQTWSIDIISTAVDVENRAVVFRTEFTMVPQSGEGVLNEILFWMLLDETGEKVARYTEFVDPVASVELARRMKAGAEQ